MAHLSAPSREFRVLALEAARAQRLEKIAESLRSEVQDLIEISDLQRRLYETNASTGGKPPSQCYAPIPQRRLDARLTQKRERSLRRSQRRAEKKRTRDNYRYYASTGFRPPHECRAPARVDPHEVPESADSDPDSECESGDDSSSTSSFEYLVKRVKHSERANP